MGVDIGVKPGLEGVLIEMFARYQKDDTNNIRAMVRYTLKNKGTREEIEEFVQSKEPVLFDRVAKYLLQELMDWPFTDKEEAKKNRSSVRDEIVGMWKNDIRHQQGEIQGTALLL